MIFHERFTETTPVEEASSAAGSTSPDWWVSSGGYLRRNAGTGSTNIGSLPATDKWRTAYAASNPRDTQDGYRPQNIFRLVTRAKWRDVYQEAAIRILGVNMADSPERDAWSGVLFFLRYVDQDNLYYAGLRHDGRAVIKRKRSGAYTTLAQPVVYPGTYHRTTNPILLPVGSWLSLRARAVDEGAGVRVTLEQRQPDGTWLAIATALDTASTRILSEGFAGIRTDFSDVELKDFRADSVPLVDLGDCSALEARVAELEAAVAAKDAELATMRAAAEAAEATASAHAAALAQIEAICVGERT